MDKLIRNKKIKEELNGLIYKCIDRDLSAWNRLAAILGPLIFHTIRDKLKRHSLEHINKDIEDLRQEMLLSIWKNKKLETLKDPDKLIPWICAYSLNTAKDYIRKMKPFDLPRALRLEEGLFGDKESPYNTLFNSTVGQDMDTALSTLNHKERLIINLLLIYEKTHREIATILNLPIGTVLVSAMRAKAKLRQRLKKYKNSM